MAIMLVYNNEKYDYAIIGLRGIEKFKNNKQTYFYNAMCDEEDFNNILNKYYKDQNRVYLPFLWLLDFAPVPDLHSLKAYPLFSAYCDPVR